MCFGYFNHQKQKEKKREGRREGERKKYRRKEGKFTTQLSYRISLNIRILKYKNINWPISVSIFIRP